MIDEEKPYAYAYVREDGVGQLCWTKRDTSLFNGRMERNSSLHKGKEL